MPALENITQCHHQLNSPAAERRSAAHGAFSTVLVSNSDKSISQGDFASSRLTRRQRVLLRDRARAKQCESATRWQRQLTAVQCLPGQGLLPEPAVFTPLATARALAIQALAGLLTPDIGPYYAGSAAAKVAADSSQLLPPPRQLAVRGAPPAASHYAVDALPGIDRALSALFRRLMPWDQAGAAESLPLDTAMAPHSAQSPSSYRIYQHADNATLLPEVLDEFLEYIDLALNDSQRLQLAAGLADNDMIFIYPAPPGVIRQPRAHEGEMKRQTMLYEMALKDKTVAKQGVATTLTAWGDERTRESHTLFIRGTENYNPFYFLASGGDALVGFFARKLGEVISGEIFARQPGQTRAEYVLEWGMNIAMLHEQKAQQAFNPRAVKAVTAPLLKAVHQPVEHLPGTVLTHPPSGLTLHSALQKEIGGQRWLLYPQGDNRALAVKVGVTPAVNHAATRNPHNHKWRIDGVSGEHQFTHGSQPTFFVKTGDGYFPVTRSGDDGCFRLASGQKIYFNELAREWQEFYPANRHLHARGLSAIPQRLISELPGQQRVLASVSDPARRIWSTQPGAQYLEVLSRAPGNPNAVRVGYVRGQLEGDFFSLEAGGSQRLYQQTVLKWQPTTQRWDSGSSPFTALKVAEGKIDISRLQSHLAPPAAMTAVYHRPGLYRIDQHYYLRWQSEAAGVQHYLELLPTAHDAEYRTRWPGAVAEIRFRYDEQSAQWHMVQFSHEVFATLPARVKQQPVTPFTAAEALPGYRHSWRRDGDTWIQAGSDQHGVAQYIRVVQDNVDEDLFTLYVPDETGPGSLMIYRYDEDDEFVLEEMRLCQPRIKRADEEPCAGPSGLNRPSDIDSHLPAEKKIRSGQTPDVITQRWLQQHPRLAHETINAADDAIVRGQKNLQYAQRLSLISPKDIPVSAIATHAAVNINRLRKSLIHVSTEVLHWFAGHPQGQRESDLDYALRLSRLAPEGVTLTAIAKKTGVKESSIRMWLSRFSSNESQWFTLHARNSGESDMAYAMRLAQEAEDAGEGSEGITTSAIASHVGVNLHSLRSNLDRLSPVARQWFNHYPRHAGEERLNYGVRLGLMAPKGVTPNAIAVHAAVNEGSLRARLNRIPPPGREWLRNHPQLDKESNMVYAIRLFRQPHEGVSVTAIAARAGVDRLALLKTLSEQKFDRLASAGEKQWLNLYPREVRESGTDYAVRLAQLRDEQLVAGTMAKKQVRNSVIALHAGISPQLLSKNLSQLKNSRLWLNNHPRLQAEQAMSGEALASLQEKNRQYALRLLQLRYQQKQTQEIGESDIAVHIGVARPLIRQWQADEKSRWFARLPRESGEVVIEADSEIIAQRKNQFYSQRLAEKRATETLSWLVQDADIADYAGITLDSFSQAQEPTFAIRHPLPEKPFDPETGWKPEYGLLHLQLKQNPPLLVDPANLELSLTEQVLGDGELAISNIRDILKTVPKAQRQATERRLLAEVKALIDTDGGRQDFYYDEQGNKQEGFLRKNLEILYDERNPVGLQVIAKQPIERYTVIGAYTGVWHATEASLQAEYRKMGSQSVITYLWGAHRGTGSTSGLQNANLLALINTAEMDNLPSQGVDNLGAAFVNDRLVVYYAKKRIERGQQLLISYGRYYRPDYRIQTTLNNDIIRIVARAQHCYFTVIDIAGEISHIYGPEGEVAMASGSEKKYLLKERLDRQGMVRYDPLRKKGGKKIAISKDDENNLYHAMAKAINPLGGRDKIEQNILAMKQAIKDAYPTEEGRVKPEPADDRDSPGAQANR
ncbi:hypothetical protein [Pantoea sp. B65]|uniref:hypothetical protein n=1 Tax=Pantoea sp. B65 TaxID=2813359 RepID=UPI0039B55151